MRIAYRCYIASAVVLTVFGIVYMAAEEIMPYHQRVLGTTWEQLDPNLQALLLTFVHATGASYLVGAVAMWFLLLIPFRRAEAWSLWAIPVIGVGLLGPSVHYARSLARATGEQTPWQLTLLGLLVLLVGIVASWGEAGRGES
jgi:hypothetical protein